MGAPAGPGYQGQLAEWPSRALSGLIDYFGLAILAGVLRPVSLALSSLISLVALVFGLYNAYLNGSTGQSIGKKVTGTRVVSAETGQLIGGGNGIVRAIAHVIDSIICFIGYLFPLWDEKKQTIADKIMKTVVITGAPKQALGDAIKSSQP
jgi:uncharacterized RDD family membrane protein YckC